MEANDIMHTEMKIQEEYYRRMRQLKLLKMNGGNIIRAITFGMYP